METQLAEMIELLVGRSTGTMNKLVGKIKSELVT